MVNLQSILSRARWRRVLSKDYGVTRIMLATTIATYYLFTPIAPWMPEKNDLFEIVGMPHFKRARSSIYFFVNEESFQCSFPSIMGSSACSQFPGWINNERSAKVTYFWMRDRLFIGGRVLISLEQDGKIVISSSDSQRLRNIIYERQKKIAMDYFIVFCLLYAGSVCA